MVKLIIMPESIQIYAELLYNIRALSLVITFKTESNADTKATLSADGLYITVTHEGDSASIRLPTEIQRGATQTLVIPAAPSKNVNFRLQLEENDPGLLKLEDFNGGNEVPWSAGELQHTSLLCKSCQTAILEFDKVNDWRDLPNENWAEMMDLWHCHKPHEEEDEKDATSSKSYSAASRFTVNPGIGFVSLLYLLLSEQDCQSIKVTPINVVCKTCSETLGSVDRTTDAVKFSKWALAIKTQSESRHYPAETWFSAQLVAAIDSEGSRRFLVQEDGGTESHQTRALLCWVFSDELTFSSSINSNSRRDPTRAMKILWKDVPVEILERIAYVNYYSPPPHHIDPATAFDAWKIRRDADKATELAVEAASGVSSQSLDASNNSLRAPPVATLSNNVKNHKRRQAALKLSQAYHLDEIATSVVTMQGATTLDEVAAIVLQRDKMDANAIYVNFFHEKIPSRQMAEYTPLTALDYLIQQQPNDAAIYRTRALTKIFKNDLLGSAKDLTDALAAARRNRNSSHGRARAVPKGYVNANGQFRVREWTKDKLPDEEHPSSMEPHLLFHRANIYLKIACDSIKAALTAFHAKQALGSKSEEVVNGAESHSDLSKLRQSHLDYRKAVKSNARKALRDYIDFMSHLDYTPGLITKIREEDNTIKQITDLDIQDIVDNEASILDGSSTSTLNENGSETPESKSPQFPDIFKLSELFSESPQSVLPPLASISTEIVKVVPVIPEIKDPNLSDYQVERASFHPLLIEALHSFLLCHALVQTSATEMRRHAINVAGIVRLLTGFPLFAEARSTSRADWIEVLIRTNDWIGLSTTWNDISRSTKSMPQRNGSRDVDEQNNQLPGEATDRAAAIAQWILEAPATVEGAKTKRKKRSKKPTPETETGVSQK